MRNFLLFTAGSMLAVSSAAAMGTGVNREPAYLMPGAETTLANVKSMTVSAKKSKAPAGKSGQAFVKRTLDNMARVTGTALDASAKEVLTVDTFLVTSQDYISWNGNVENQRKITYDKYGRRATMKDGDTDIRYTYTTDSQNRWLTRVVERKGNFEDTWRITNKEERTIAGDRVTSITFYTTRRNDYTDKYECFKSGMYEFEYGHGGDEEWNMPYPIRNAAVSHYVSYDSDGSILTEQRYAWMEAAGRYVMTYMSDGRSRSETSIADDHTTTVNYWRNGEDGPFVKVNEEIVYFGSRTGTVYINYENGSYESSYGSVSETSFDGQGNKVEIDYEYVHPDLVPKYKNVYSPDCQKEVDYSADFNREEIGYAYSAGEWSEYRRSVFSHHLLPNGLSEIKQKSGNYGYTQIVKAERKTDTDGNESWELLAAKVNDDNSYMTSQSGYGSDYNAYVYKYYGADGGLQKTILQTRSNVNDETVFFIQLPGETAWSPLDEYTLTETDGSGTLRTVYKTSADGRPLSVTEYLTSSRYNNGQEFKSLETLYTYSGNGDFVATTYEVFSPKDVTKMALSEKVERNTLADGTIQLTNWEYDDDGSEAVESAWRTDYKDYVTRSYAYKTRTGTWELTGVNCTDENCVTDDGVSVTISRRVADDGLTVVYDRKTEEKNIEDAEGNTLYSMSAAYNWDSDKNSWIGDSKYVDENWHYTFECHSESEFNPIEAYNDEYMVVMETGSTYKDNYEHSDSKSWSYEWDYDKNDWKLSSSSYEDFDYSIDGDVLTTVKTESRNEDWETAQKIETEKVTRDAMKRIVRRDVITEEWKQQDGGEKETSYSHDIHYYTYNEMNGLLAEVRNTTIWTPGGEEEPGGAGTERYTYEKFSIEPFTGVDDVMNGDSKMVIDGNNVEAIGQTINIYSMNGVLVSSSRDRAILPSAAGVYVVKAGNAVCKVVK